MKDGRGDEGSAWVGVGGGGGGGGGVVGRLCRVVGNVGAPVSSAHLTGNLLTHILSLSETLVCIPVAQLSEVF